MRCRRHLWSLSLLSMPWLAWLTSACGGPETKLITLRPPGSQAELTLIVRNRSDAVIDGFYLAKTEKVRTAVGHTELGSVVEAETWGNDLLSAALQIDDEQQIRVRAAGNWDARPVDEAGRFQHIAGLRLKPGARYVLELHDDGWRQFR